MRMLDRDETVEKRFIQIALRPPMHIILLYTRAKEGDNFGKLGRFFENHFLFDCHFRILIIFHDTSLSARGVYPSI
jgi:hypothetical protein